jgi:hypothetical protein
MTDYFPSAVGLPIATTLVVCVTDSSQIQEIDSIWAIS